MIRLFHGTSEFAYQKIQATGFIGINEDDYTDYVNDIFDILNVPLEKRCRFITRMRQEVKEYAPNGSVSFFPTWREHENYLKLIGSQLGEGFGNTLQHAIKYASRVTKTAYRNNLQQVPFLHNQQVVVLEVNLPVNLIANQDDIGSTCELYTNGKVPIRYIQDIIFLR